MKTKVLVLVALTVLLGACTAPQSQKLQARDLGVRPTAWGELREYSLPGMLHMDPAQHAKVSRTMVRVKGTTVLDLLIEPNGKVRDISIAQSSGDPVLDEAVRTMHVGATVPRIPGYTSSAPYVSRIATKFDIDRDSSPQAASYPFHQSAF